jgi:hypothetical protein
MLISKDNSGRIVGWQEVYIGDREIVTVSVNGTINVISTRDRTTGRVESKTFFGKPLLPSSVR